MNPDSISRNKGEVTFAINLENRGDKWQKRPGHARKGATPSPIAAPVNGLYDYILPRGTEVADVGFRNMLIAGADDKTSPDNGGKLYYYDVSSGVWTQINGSVPLLTGVNAKHQFVTIHGKLYGINKSCKPYKYYPNDANAFELVVPTDGGFLDPSLHVCYSELPIAQMIGTFDSRLVLGNFQSGAGPYAVNYPAGASVIVDRDGPVTAWFSEPIIDTSPDVAFQVKEFFSFTTARGQELVAQRQFQDNNVFFLSHSCHKLVGSNADEYYAIPLTYATGCVSAHSIQELDSIGADYYGKAVPGLVWLSPNGFYFYNGSSVAEADHRINRIFMEMYGAYEAAPFLIDRSRLWNVTSRVDRRKGIYECWVPIGTFPGNQMKFVFDYKNGGWYLGGMGSFVDPATGYLSKSEHGENAECAAMLSTDEYMDIPVHADIDGWVNEQSNDWRDAYMELLGTTGSTAGSIHVSLTDYSYLNYLTADTLKGATLMILDDRTASERTSGATPTGRIDPGTQRTVTASAGNGSFSLTLDSDLPHVPQNGCQFALYWPIRCRWWIEMFSRDSQTIKDLRMLWIRAKCHDDQSMRVWYQGDPSKIDPDQSILPITPAVTLAASDATYASPQDFRVNCAPPYHKGRKIAVIVEEFSTEDFQLWQVMTDHAVVGYR